MQSGYEQLATTVATEATRCGRVFIHDTPQGANVSADAIDSPVLEMRILESAIIDLNQSWVQPRLNVLLLFLSPVAIDANGAEVQRVFDAAFSDCVSVARLLNERYKVEGDTLTIDPVLDEHDACLGGCAIRLTLLMPPQCWER